MVSGRWEQAASHWSGWASTVLQQRPRSPLGTAAAVLLCCCAARCRPQTRHEISQVGPAAQRRRAHATSAHTSGGAATTKGPRAHECQCGAAPKYTQSPQVRRRDCPFGASARCTCCGGQHFAPAKCRAIRDIGPQMPNSGAAPRSAAGAPFGFAWPNGARYAIIIIIDSMNWMNYVLTQPDASTRQSTGRWRRQDDGAHSHGAHADRAHATHTSSHSDR